MFQMVISLTSWKFPDWLTRSTGSKKRKLEHEEEEIMEVDVDTDRHLVEQSVKKLKPNPPCKQCLAGIPGHRSHVQSY